MLLPLFTPQVHKQEISNLPSYHFYIKVNALTPQDSFSGSTTNFIVENNEAIRKEIIEHSRNTYGKSVEVSAVVKYPVFQDQILNFVM
jgi:hypothetical protein